MSAEPEAVATCEECGATIYPEHVTSHSADRWNGKLLCPHCLAQKRPAGASAKGAVVSALRLDDDAGVAGAPMVGSVKTVAAIGTIRSQKLRRPMLKGSPHATRCRTFHCKLTDAAMNHLNEQVNEWADSNDDIEIKFATSSVGVIEGKHLDPHLLLTVFY